ncbi:TraB/GumN family protein [Bacteroides eggerthii]|nr:TraB/GumN family protein [Bacteroides eggerthii]RHB93887.1 hypothetical protein DW866_09045 [Bacteroides eggerthii]
MLRKFGFADYTSLIAVGATHLIGINGLIAKLRNLGYNVDPMR